jgi:lipopolysaccharide transport system permease protein
LDGPAGARQTKIPMNLTAKENMGALEPAAAAQPAAGAAPLAHGSVPEEPLVVVDAKAPWGAINLRELWAYRELLYFLTWRDVKVRYNQTALGVAWVVMQPLLTTLIFTVVLGILARVPSDGVPYPLFVFAGLLPWMFFASALLGSGNSLIGNAHLITKVYFPRLIVPAAAVAGRLIDFAVSFVVLAALHAYYGVWPGRGVLLLPALVALLGLLALGAGLLTSAMNVKYRDVGMALPVAVQLWMFASPVLYPSSLIRSAGVPEAWQWLYILNPLVGIVEGFRSALFGRPFNWPALAISAAFTVALFLYSAYAFRKMEKSFADVI